ncbi:MAG TPA: glycosyltransferase family 39 protein [Polyangiaceae bacterium]|nr:glycosyltransferase family 39 protein [Polyangiaceae bacterium]
MSNGARSAIASPERRVVLALACAGLLLFAFLVQCIAFARANGQTYDEGINLASGFRILHDHRNDVNLEHPPLAKVLAALPVWLFSSPRLDVAAWAARHESGFGLGRDFLYRSGVPHERLLLLGRAPMIVVALLLVALVGLWAWRLWGPRAGLLALTLAAFDPNLVAHGSLVGHDVPLALFTTSAFFCVHQFHETRRLRWLWLAGLAAGLMLATKHSAPLLVAILCVASVVHAARTGEVRAWWRDHTAPAPGRTHVIVAALGNGLLVVGIALLVLRLLLGEGGYPSYFAGVRAQLAHQRFGHPAFLLGEVSRTGWRAYFPLALALKTPPLTLALTVASLALAKRGAPLARAIACVVVPLAMMLVALLPVRVDIGARYALPLVPLVIVIASRVITIPLDRWARAVLMAGVLHHVFAAGRVAPHDLAFFSDVVGGPTHGHQYLADSNLDWGQDVSTLGRWLATQAPPQRLYLAYFGTAPPEAYGVAYRPAPNSCPHPAPWQPSIERVGPTSGRELLAVSTMNLQGVFFDDPHAYGWLEHERPIEVLGYSISIYDITGDAAAHRALARMYERWGPRELAAEETARAAALAPGRRGSE